MNDCWMFQKNRPCFVLLGRFGDLIQIFPCFKAIRDRTGQIPVVIVAKAYSSLFDGVSYAESYELTTGWWQGVPKARQVARALFGAAVFPRWWEDDEAHDKMIEEGTAGDFVLQCHGDKWGVNLSKWPDYGTSMAYRCGFSREEWVRLPLVFDKRSEFRERQLREATIGRDPRPVVLYNFEGNSSPFPFTPEIQAVFRNTFTKAFRFVDLGNVRAARIYDLLGLYDHAVGLLTSDTSTLHLAPASKIPYIAFTVDGWTSSVPKGNCVLHLKYSQAMQSTQKMIEHMSRWKR